MKKAKNVQKVNNSFNNDGWIDMVKKIGIHSDVDFCLKLGNDKLFASLYTGDGIVKRYIDLFSRDMIREWINVPEDTDGVILKGLDQINTKHEIGRAIIDSKLFGGSVIFMAIDDGKRPNEPVNVNGINSIKKLKCFPRTRVTIDPGNYYNDLSNDNFGEPEYFTLYNDNSTPFVVHESRCLVIQGDYYPANEIGIRANHEAFWGMSSLQPIYEELQSFGISQKALYRVLLKSNIDVLKIDGLMDLLRNKDGQKKLDARANSFDLSKSISNTLLLDTKESFEVVNQALNGMGDLFEKMQESLSSITGVPASIFFGKSPGSLNATGDNEIMVYYDKVRSEQEIKLKNPLSRIVNYFAHSKGLKKEYTVNFNSLWQKRDKETVEIRKIQSEIDSAYITHGVYSPTEVRESRFSNDNYSIETNVEKMDDLYDNLDYKE